MGIVRAMQLYWVILGFLLLQGHNSQPRTMQSSSPQGTFSLSLITESTPNPVTPEMASRVPTVARKSVMPRSITTESNSSIFPGPTQSQPQEHISDLGTGVPRSNSNGGSESGNTSQNVTIKSATMSLRTREDSILPSPTSETVLTVAAFGVISFIVILVVVVIILVSVVSLRFKCRKNKEPEDPQKPGSSGLSESCSTANGEKESITLISMKNINMNNSKGCRSAEKVL